VDAELDAPAAGRVLVLKLVVERVVVVGHSGVFDKLLGLQMKNCELVEHVLK
jgi:hypothetical protein